MKILILFAIFLVSCSEVISDCLLLPISVSESDQISEDDAEFGVGDDDLFTAHDFQVFIHGKELQVLNDYDLQTAYSGKFLVADTFNILLDFSGLRRNFPDTAILIKEFVLFNGNRASKEIWEESNKIKNIQIKYHNKCIGKATLQSTYKLQTIDLQTNSLPMVSGNVDSIQLIVQSVYTNRNIETNYSLSEIKLGGVKYY